MDKGNTIWLLIDMFPWTSVFGKNAKNPLICFRKRKVQKISPRHQSERLVPCGVRNRNAKERYLEILKFQHFANFVTFTTDGDDFRNKVLKDKIDVSVVLDLECVDMCALIRVFRYVYITQYYRECRFFTRCSLLL